MARRFREGGGTGKVRGRKAKKARSKTPTKVRRHKRSPTAELRKQLRGRTAELAEAQERQAATAEVLRVISSSPGELKPVFESMLANAMHLCEANCGFIYRVEAGAMRAMAEIGVPAPLAEYRQHHLHTGGATTPVDLMRTTGKPAHVHDARDSDAYRMGNPNAVAGVELGGARTVLFVPMMRNNDIVGVINLFRQEVRPFTDEQIALLEHFAGQAVVAIENARLLNELRESIRQQSATAEVLKVISRSPDRLKPVLDVIAETSRELCNAFAAVIFLLRDGKFHDVAESSAKPDYIEELRANPISSNQRGSILARSARERRTVHIPNSAQDPEAGLGGPLDRGGPRSLLSVPLIRDGRAIGAITLQHLHLAPFTPRQIEAVETFADQAVIAISNVNLFEQVQQRSNELSKSLDDLHAAQDRLIQTEKLASLGQLTAGIAHEIKNPLNFMNNFSSLSAELVDEMSGVLEDTGFDEKKRVEFAEIRDLLKSNLEKVVQHGKRADSIVKNMMLHSRSGSGERGQVEINAVVDESLNLAYHGARAERQGFTIALERDFDPAAGVAEVYPQEITRVLLNLVSNGFYAATKRAAESGNGFEPKLKAMTRNLGNQVEIRIRDNGTGIASEVRGKIFNPFFTTKPAGEGTGLGLSISHDIVVKQHGGRIDVVTEPGTFTEFVITLPRIIGAPTVAGEQQN
jgi:two-component system, NtrC family, sensor kinase